LRHHHLTVIDVGVVSPLGGAAKETTDHLVAARIINSHVEKVRLALQLFKERQLPSP
jgi:hypothetical protein